MTEPTHDQQELNARLGDTHLYDAMHTPAEPQVDHDFDAAWAARRAKPIRVRILGSVYELPTTVPAKVILLSSKLSRMQSANTEVSFEQVVDMLESMLGVDNVKKWLDAGLPMEHFQDVLAYCMERYKERQTPGKPQAPAPGAPMTRTPATTLTSSG
ncbi:MAG TPA: hypothetical protein VFC19_49530 [Candidatus Limnocylindrales bacterium]|nr:hypothetical protein [Candidatus Limnocylindrales bacterium]